MQFLAAAIWAWFAANMIPLAIRLLVGIGVGAATFTGVKALLDYALAQVQSAIGASGATVVEWAAFFNVDRAITIIFSALAIRWTLRGLDKVTDSLRTTTFAPPTAPAS